MFRFQDFLFSARIAMTYASNQPLRRMLAWAACAGLFTVAILFAPAAPAQHASGPVVTVTGGRIQGALLEAGAVFKGIPYAQPPVGNLRWREPQPVKSWTGVRPATQYANTCAQIDSGWNKMAAAKGSEDCLYLNLWTPQWPAKAKLPVMLWLHGGGNTGGSSLGAGGIEPPFDGASLASHGVILVTINYRLGIFGFVGHPELTAESPHHASGGYGMLDQIAALRWVHDNIARFGGDPGNVTVFGQSAGGRDTSILLTSPPARGLFQKAISESGSPMSGDRHMQTPAQMEEMGVILGQVLKAPSTGTIAYLRSLPASTLLGAQKEYVAELKKHGLSLDIGVDGYAVPRYAAQVYRSGQEEPIPMIYGSNGQDNVGERIGNPSDTPEQKRAAAEATLKSFYAEYPDLLARALKIYGFSGPENDVSTYPPYGPVDIQLGSDLAIRCGATVILGWHSAVAPTWEYEFDAGTANHPPHHSAELDFVFGYLRDQAARPNLVKLSEEMQEYWTNFAKTSDPNGPGLPPWPRYHPKSREYVRFANDGISTQSNLRPAACGLWAERLNRDLDARLKK